VPHTNAPHSYIIVQTTGYRRDLLCLAAVLAFFYLFWLGGYPLFTPDEGRYSEVAREMVASADYITPRVDGVAFLDKPVLYYWLQAAAIHLFGVKEWALRLFPALAGILGCLMTYICGRRLFNRVTGLTAALILATSPLYFGAAHYANLDLEVAVLTSCALLCFLTGTQEKETYRAPFLIAAYIFAALAFLTKGLIGIAFPAMIAGTWILLLGRWRLLKQIYPVRGLMLFSILVLPWYVLVQQANPEFLHYFFVTQQVSRFLSAGEFNNKTVAWFYVPVVLMGFFPWTIFLLQALYQQIRQVWQARMRYQNELFLLLWVAVVFIFFSIPHSKIMTYILPLFPALALLIANYIAGIWNQARQKTVFFTILSYALINLLLATVALIFIHHDWSDIFSPDFAPYATTVSIILIISSVLSLRCLHKEKLFSFFAIAAGSMAICLMTLLLGAHALNHYSIKPLVGSLKEVIKPQEEVITYFKYYQDLPLYLGQRVTIVADWNSPEIPYHDNWIRELWYGMAFQKTDDWLINEETFWKRWQGPKRVFVFVNANYLNQFKRHAKHYVVIKQQNDIILVSNQSSEIPKTY